MIEPLVGTGGHSWRERVVYRDGFVVLNGIMDDFSSKARADTPRDLGSINPHYFGILRANKNNPLEFYCTHHSSAQIRPVNAPSTMTPAGIWCNENLWMASCGLLMPYRLATNYGQEHKTAGVFEHETGFSDAKGATSPATLLFHFNWSTNFGNFHTASHVADSQLADHLFQWLVRSHQAYSMTSFPDDFSFKPKGHIELGPIYARRILPDIVKGLQERFDTRLRLSDF